jgi:hypothetical protein
VSENIIHIETGELREGGRSSARLFFVYMTPTGGEAPIYKCPFIKKIGGWTDGGFEGNTRQSTTEWEVKSACTLKMVNIYSVYGRPSHVANLIIEVDPEQAAIELSGVEGFGKFKGRAKVNKKRSTFKIGHGPFIINDDTLRNSFGFKILQPPKKGAGGKATRSLIF